MLSVENLSVDVGDRRILADISFRVDEGNVLALVGPSGSGKTTLLRTIAGLQPASSGRVRWKDGDVTDLAAHKRQFGLMFQDHALFPHMSVEANIGFGLRMQRLGKAEIRQRVQELLDLVQMTGFGARSINTLSGGEQQRVALARALAPRPQLLLLDEPFGSLDSALRMELLDELQILLARLSMTAIVVTHDHREARLLGNDSITLDSGRVVRVGQATGVVQSPDSQPVVILCGGDLDGVTAERLPPAPFVIAADSGLQWAEPLGLDVDLLIGDMDSASPALVRQAAERGVRVAAVPAEKHMTDLELALLEIPEDAASVTIVGGLGGRIEHSLGNLSALAGLRHAATVLFGAGELHVVHNHVTLSGRPSDLISIIPFGGDAHGVTTNALRWQLDDQTLLAKRALGIDNEMTGASASVELSNGVLLVIHTRNGQ